ncbi:MAG: putative toxin-antitoxin system toxin component, PIN family [Sphingobacteriales bacterium]
MKPEYWVLDTNTLLSALLYEGSVPGIGLKKARETGTLLVSAETASEYFNVFSRPKFEKYVSLEIRLAFIENIISNALQIEPKERVIICRDPKDNKFLELALTAGASCIISGDQDLLVLHPFNSIPIVSAADFLRLF